MYRVGYCSAIRKQRDLFTCNDMDDLKGIMPSEIRQTENDKYCTISLMCVIQKNKVDEQTKQHKKTRHREQAGGCHTGGVWAAG